MYPSAQSLGRKSIQNALELWATLPIALTESGVILTMGQVQATNTSPQKLSPRRWHGIVNRHRNAGATKDFGSHQTGWPGTDNGHRPIRSRHSLLDSVHLPQFTL